MYLYKDKFSSLYDVVINCVFHTWWDYRGIVKDYWILTLHRYCSTNSTDFCFYQSFLTNRDEECDHRQDNNNITTTTRTRPTGKQDNDNIEKISHPPSRWWWCCCYKPITTWQQTGFNCSRLCEKCQLHYKFVFVEIWKHPPPSAITIRSAGLH